MCLDSEEDDERIDDLQNPNEERKRKLSRYVYTTLKRSTIILLGGIFRNVYHAVYLKFRRVSRQKSKLQRDEELDKQLKLKHRLSTNNKLIEEEEEERGSVSVLMAQIKHY